MKINWYLLGATLAIAGAGGAKDVFRNDFDVRTSEGAVPENRWISYDYVASDAGEVLYYNYPVNQDMSKLPYSKGWIYPEDSSKINYQDYWARAFMDDVNNRNPPGFVCAYASPGNACACFRSSDKKSGTAVQPFWNEFTNGVLRFEIDIRRPAVWGGTGDTYCCRVLPVYKKYVDDLGWRLGVNSTKYPVMFGAMIDDSDKKTDRLVILYTDRDTEKNGTLYPGKSGDNYVCNEHWYRWRVYVNLDEQRSTAYIWDGGDTQPTGRNEQDDSTATRTVINEKYGFRSPMTEETGGIAGIGLNVYRTFSGTGSSFNIANAACFDNIHLAWKAPGSNEYVPFYDNDFTTRRVRRIEPAGATSCVYPRNVETSVQDLYEVYPTTTNRNDVASGALTQIVIQGDNRKPEPVGIDNWRRLCGRNRASVIESETAYGGKVLRIWKGVNSEGVLAQTFGESLTVGKVRVSADVRLPKEWGAASTRRVALAMGNDTYWRSCDKDNFTQHYIGYAGIVGDTANEFCPAYVGHASVTESMVSTKRTDIPCVATNWYRIVMTADIDAQKYDYELYKLGTSAGNWDRGDATNCIFTVSNVVFRNTLADISSFGLASYAPHDDNEWYSFILWDNIRVWKNWGSSNEKEIYRNNFNLRYRYFDREKTPLVGEIHRDAIVDGWVRRLKGDGAAWLTGEANRCLTFKAVNQDYAYVAHPIGTVLKQGQRVRVRMDMRPPSEWSFADSSNSRCTLYLGGDEMLQYATGMNWLEKSVLAFGVGGKDMSLSRLTNTFFRVQNGGALADTGVNVPDKSHWYRFEGTTVVGEDTWSCKVYDMGAAHPGIDAPNGACIVDQKNLARRGPADMPITSLLITSSGITSRDPWDPYDPARVFIDNLVVTKVDSDALIIIR